MSGEAGESLLLSSRQTVKSMVVVLSHTDKLHLGERFANCRSHPPLGFLELQSLFIPFFDALVHALNAGTSALFLRARSSTSIFFSDSRLSRQSLRRRLLSIGHCDGQTNIERFFSLLFLVCDFRWTFRNLRYGFVRVSFYYHLHSHLIRFYFRQR